MCLINNNRADTHEASHDILQISGIVRYRVAAGEAGGWGTHMGRHYCQGHQLHYVELKTVLVEHSQIRASF